MSDSLALAGLIIAPLFAGFYAFVVPVHGRSSAAVTAFIVPVCLTSLMVEVTINGVVQHAFGGWGAPLGIELYADGLAAFMLLTTTLVCVATLIYAWDYFHDHGADYFWPLALLLWAALNALFLAGDIFNLYVTLELLGLLAVGLTAASAKRESLQAALRYLVIGLAASACYLLGVALIYGTYAVLDIRLLADLIEVGAISRVALALMTVALLTKSALFPMHFWLPPAHANAPAPVSGLLSALVVKASFYILLRLWFEVFSGVSTVAAANFIGLLGAVSVLWGSIQALRQTRIKLMVAYSTVAQLGYLFMVFPLAAVGQHEAALYGVLYLVLAHACAKGAMFLGAGTVLHGAGHDRIDELHGLAKHMPVTVFTFALAGVSLMGLPPSGGFVAKWSLLVAALASGQWFWALVLMVGSLLAAAYVFKLLSPALLARGDSTEMGSEKQWPLMVWPAFALALLAVALGFLSPLSFKLLGVSA